MQNKKGSGEKGSPGPRVSKKEKGRYVWRKGTGSVRMLIDHVFGKSFVAEIAGKRLDSTDTKKTRWQRSDVGGRAKRYGAFAKHCCRQIKKEKKRPDHGSGRCEITAHVRNSLPDKMGLILCSRKKRRKKEGTATELALKRVEKKKTRKIEGQRRREKKGLNKERKSG